jgi:hypothetical protein
MLDWKQLTHLSDAELAKLDIAEVNLACAAGLPESNKIDVDHCLRTLNLWAAQVHGYTRKATHLFEAHPGEYGSWAQFRILAMITCLQRDLGVRYNPAKIREDAVFNADDDFIHGVIQGSGGTCASLPVVYAAVGRRLGYPIKLVMAWGNGAGHLFARWDDPHGERFNIEASGKGLVCPPDNYYREGFYQISPEFERRCYLLKSMTPKEEFATFLKQRGFQWKELGNYRKAVESFSWAYAAAPHNEGLQASFGLTMNEWHEELRKQQPPGYPEVFFFWPKKRRLPACVPEQMEKSMLFLEATENLLRNPKHKRDWWEPMKNGIRTETRPAKVNVRFRDVGCEMQVHVVKTV